MKNGHILRNRAALPPFFRRNRLYSSLIVFFLITGLYLTVIEFLPRYAVLYATSHEDTAGFVEIKTHQGWLKEQHFPFIIRNGVQSTPVKLPSDTRQFRFAVHSFEEMELHCLSIETIFHIPLQRSCSNTAFWGWKITGAKTVSANRYGFKLLPVAYTQEDPGKKGLFASPLRYTMFHPAFFEWLHKGFLLVVMISFTGLFVWTCAEKRFRLSLRIEGYLKKLPALKRWMILPVALLIPLWTVCYTIQNVDNGELAGIAFVGVEMAEKSPALFGEVKNLKGPYDGSLYYAMAHDPLLLSSETTAEIKRVIDYMKYRYERPLYPLLVSLFSFGDNRNIPAALIGVNLAAILLLGLLFYQVLQKGKRTGNILWFSAVMISPFLIIPLLRDLVDALLLLFLIGGVCFAIKEKHKTSALFFCVGMFVKPTIALVALCYFIQNLRQRRADVVLLYCFMGMLYLLWRSHLVSLVGQDPFDIGLTTITVLPLMGELSNLFFYMEQGEKLNTFFIPVLLFAIALTCILFLHRWEATPLSFALLLYAVFFLFFSEAGAIEYHGYIRSTGPLFLLQSVYGILSGRLLFLAPTLILTAGAWLLVYQYGITVLA